MNKLLWMACCLIVACTDSAVNPFDAGPPDAGTTDSGMPGPPPLKASQVDRMGRAAVNTVLTAPFDSNTSTADQKKDDYNAASNRSQWGSAFKGELAASLATYDGLDRTCGNQFEAGANVAAGRYDTLALVLADDVLIVNTTSGVCVDYLGVETNATGAFPNSDCGGRTPLEDAIDVTHSLLITGSTSGVTDGVALDTDSPHASTTAFPFLATQSP